MSGIYIPGMKIPESCSECLDIGWNYVFECHLDDAEEGKRLTSCPLIPVPDHGDLIDREKLYEQTANWEAQALDQTLRYRPEEDRDEWRRWSVVLKERSAFKFDVADAPAIIPADKEGEG